MLLTNKPQKYERRDIKHQRKNGWIIDDTRVMDNIVIMYLTDFKKIQAPQGIIISSISKDHGYYQIMFVKEI